jgi:Flp pilus assembly protein TadD
MLDEQVRIFFFKDSIVRGLLSIYDGNYKEAIETFRKVLAIKPANIVAANNCATCQM